MLEQTVKGIEIDHKFEPLIKTENKVLKIDAEGLYYRELNTLLREVIKDKGVERIEIHNVCGQR